MAQVQDDAWLIHMVMKEELMNKKKEIRRAQMAFYQMIRGLHWAHAKAVSDLRNDFAREIRRLESNFDRSLFEKNDKLEEEHDKELHKMAVAKEDQINYMIEEHAWQADQMKAFFQELLKISLDIVQQMKLEVKQQTTAELMQRRDYEHFKHRYDVYVAPALKWSTLMDEWTITHQEDNLNELMSTLKTKEDELTKRKYSMRMLEAANEALNQRILIAEKERNCIKKQFCRSIVDSQRSTSMKRFCHQLKRKAARDEAEVFFALNKLVRDRGSGVNHFKNITDQKDEEALDLMIDINQHAREHLETQYEYADAFDANEINLDDIGYPIQQLGVNTISRQDMENLMEANKNWKPEDGEEDEEGEVMWDEQDSGYDLVDAPPDFKGQRGNKMVGKGMQQQQIGVGGGGGGGDDMLGEGLGEAGISEEIEDQEDFDGMEDLVEEGMEDEEDDYLYYGEGEGEDEYNPDTSVWSEGASASVEDLEGFEEQSVEDEGVALGGVEEDIGEDLQGQNQEE